MTICLPLIYVFFSRVLEPFQPSQLLEAKFKSSLGWLQGEGPNTSLGAFHFYKLELEPIYSHFVPQSLPHTTYSYRNLSEGQTSEIPLEFSLRVEVLQRILCCLQIGDVIFAILLFI